mmetsp:Transcript_8225/g.24652  ORF Transcript_8225/g.24652 Transcript_8225/m.24652 type:complete len:305 (-) Transcript_8225:24-938(-)
MAAQLASQAEDAAGVGDRDTAIKLYKRAIEMDPKNERYKTALESLEHANGAMQTFLERFAQQKADQRWEKVDRSPDSEETETPELLCRCAEKGDVPGLKGLLATGASPNAWNPLRHGDSALHFAKDANIAQILLDKGATVDAGKRGWTPLMAAVRFGRVDVAKLLLEKGANPKARVLNGPGAGQGLLLCVTAGSHLSGEQRTEMTELLLQKGAEVGACERGTDWTPLHDACLTGDEGVANLLLLFGANPNAASTKPSGFLSDGYKTPSDVAKANGHEDLVQLLRHYEGTFIMNLHCYAGPQGRV